MSCLYVAPWMLGHLDWYAMDGYREFLFFVPFQQFFLIGPVILFYIKSLLDPDTKGLKREDFLHFIPAALYLLYSLIVFVTDFLILDEFYFYADGRDKDLSPWYQISGLACIITYTVFGIKLYSQYRKEIVNQVSYAENIKFGWLKKFLIALLVILTIRILFLIFLPNWGDFGIKWWYYFFFACVFYYIALSGYKNAIQSSILFEPGWRLISPDRTEEKLTISAHEITSWKEKIRVFIEEERAYQNSNLTLRDVANSLGTNTRLVSQVINQGFKMNFNDFINDFRLKTLKVKLQNGEHKQFTLLSLALDCGFNSKSTFNRVFKKSTGLTPNQFISHIESQKE
ncbi:helix-turn-helix domain-containing protein [Ekhidna sp.]